MNSKPLPRSSGGRVFTYDLSAQTLTNTSLLRARSKPVKTAEEQVQQLDLGIVPEAAVSGPLLLQSDYTACLTFNAMRLNKEGMYQDAGTAIIEIVNCNKTMFGYPNDEALSGHPLFAKGLDCYGIYEVLNSFWIAEQAAQNRITFPDSTMSGLRHFIFVFHDSTFECSADDIKIEVSEEPYEQILQRLTERILRAKQ